jgi:Acetyltransferase (GNAT) domain
MHPNCSNKDLFVSHGERTVASVFHNSWWLDAATEENWQLLETDQRSGFVARLPIYKKRKYWQSVITMPPLTRTLGPTIHQIAKTRKMPDPSERVRVVLIQDIVKEIPQDTIFFQVFDPVCTDLYPFHVGGFSVRVAYTFRIIDCSDTEKTWTGMRDKTRNVIRRAMEASRVHFDPDPQRFLTFFLHVLEKAGERSRWPAERIRSVVTAAVTNGAGTALYASNDNGKPVAAIFLLWDEGYCYYFLSSRDAALSENGSVSLLLWEALQFAGKRGLGFDFDGFNTTGAAQFLSQFGARAIPRWVVTKIPRYLRAIEALFTRS